MKKLISILFLIGFSLYGYSQEVKGTVTDVANVPVPGANVIVKDTQQGTTTNFNGKFSIKVKKLPVKLVISYLGYETTEINVIDTNNISVKLQENNEFLDDVVITASRKKESIKESPVSIEVLSLKEMKRNSSPTFYDGLSNLKGVDLNTSSLTFQSVNTRGFAAFANERFVQLLDGMDNSSPALNFPLGNLVGMSELDVARVEILPGASSALYGANAFNGILNMQSKNPFKYKGLSAYVKYGQTKQKAAGTNPYTDLGVRYAWGGKHAAAKVNFSFLKGTDWFAVDMSDIDLDPTNNAVKGSRVSNPSYDGMNIYGDEIATTLPISSLTGGALSDIRVSRTGYAEADLTDYQAKSVKGDIAFHYRPSGKTDKLEFIWNTRFGTGQTMYQGANRYALKDIFIHQHKLEIKSDNFFVRAYYTGEEAGNSYDTKFTAWNVNRKWRSDEAWFTDYAAIYAGARFGILPGMTNPANESEAHAIARDYADNSPVDYQGNPKTPRFNPGTPEFTQAFNEVIADPDFKTGGKFIDHSSISHIEGNYNFKNQVKFAEIQVGGSLRKYALDSKGTIFTDYEGLDPLSIQEQGAYVQLGKKVMDDKLKLSASLRYDKQNNFDGNFSPRISAVYSTGTHKEHNFRMSYQTGFRNPTTQSLYIGLDLGPITLVGAAPDNWDRYNETIVATDPGTGTQFDANISGKDAYTNAYTLNSFVKFGQTHNPADLEIAKTNKIHPEQVSTVEFGYRGQILKKLGIDFSVYYNKYNNFGSSARVMALSSQLGSVNDATAMNAIGTGAFKPFQIYLNAEQEVNSYGMDISFSYKIANYRLGLIYDYANLDFDQAANPDFRTGFNTPEHRIKFSFGNDKLYKDLGFRINYKYQTEFKWEASFADGMVPARSILDTQISYNLKKYNTQFKLGATNLIGAEYLPAPGTGMIGSMFYLGLTYSK